MKNKILITIFGFAMMFFTSCQEGDNIVDEVIDGQTTGAVLRTIEIISSDLPIGNEEAAFSVIIEAQDEQNGGLLDSVDVFVTFSDNSQDSGDSSNAITDEVFVRTIPASDFAVDPSNNLPRTTVTIPLTEFLSLVNLQPDDIFGGDVFQVRFELKLTDGRVFSDYNASGNIANSAYFNSPFSYASTVTCDVPEEFGVGTYNLEIIEGVFPLFGATIDWVEGPVEIINTGGTKRQIVEACYLPEFGSFCGPLEFQLICGNVFMPEQAPGGGVGCGSAILLETSLDDQGSYDPTAVDDSVITLVFINNKDNSGGCGGGTEYRSELRLTKI